MKVIFLDIDGVLNTIDCYKPYEDDDFSSELPQDKHLKVLKEIVDKTGADIVLSSGWRMALNNQQEVFDALNRFGMCLRGVTPDTAPKSLIDKHRPQIHPRSYSNFFGDLVVADRGAEILAWLVKHPEYKSVLILDDEVKDIKDYFPNNFIQTSITEGLLPKHIEPAINILNSQLN